MKISIAYPPIKSGKGVPLLYQNRQFQWFNSPTYIYPCVPASAATLLSNSGHDVLWNDGIAKEQTFDAWMSKIKRESPDIIAIETKTPVVRNHRETAEKIKAELPDAKIVMMGDHATAMPEETFSKSPADYVLTGGDYDFMLLSLAEHISKRKKLEPGFFFRKGKSIRSTGKFELKHNLDSLPFIDRELTQWKLYSEKNGNFRKTPGTYTMAGRDCWHRKDGGCRFCSWTTLFPTFRARSPELIADETEMLINDYGVRSVFDDSGTLPAGTWLKRFCRRATEGGFRKRADLGCNMRFGALSFEEYRMMKKAGFRMLLFGIESANQGTLDRINKNLRVETIKDSCMKAKKAGLSPHITIMFGYPWETKKDAKRTLELGKWLLRKGYADTVQATITIPYPGTPLFEECRKAGLLNTLDWDRYDMREPVMKTPMTDEEITEMVRGIYGVAFSPEFLARKLFGIRDMEDIRFFFRAGRKVIGHLTDFSNKTFK